MTNKIDQTKPGNDFTLGEIASIAAQSNNWTAKIFLLLYEKYQQLQLKYVTRNSELVELRNALNKYRLSAEKLSQQEIITVDLLLQKLNKILET